MSELLNSLRSYRGPWLFWVCPNGCRGMVIWNTLRKKWWAKCGTCGKTSKLMTPKK